MVICGLPGYDQVSRCVCYKAIMFFRLVGTWLGAGGWNGCLKLAVVSFYR